MRGCEGEAVNSRYEDLELGAFELELKESEQGLKIIFALLSFLLLSAILTAAELLASLSSLFLSIFSFYLFSFGTVL